MATPQHRFTCPHCGLQGWWNPSSRHVVDPLHDHDRPDGRRCRKAEKTATKEP